MAEWGGILGLQNGIVVAPMGPDITGPELVAAVANAGGLGLIRAPSQVEALKAVVARTRELTSKPFGVAIVLAFPHEELLHHIYAEKVAFLQVYFGEFPKARVDEAHAMGVKVLHQVGTVADAVKAAEAGVDAIICQGFEAGGHIISRTGLWTLLPSVVDAVQAYKVPVIAAGGIVDGRGYVAALALGAQGVCMGTRFLATVEANAHPLYKQQIVDAGPDGTEFPDIFGRAGWPGGSRVLRTPFFETWKHKLGADENENHQPVIGHSQVFGQTVDITRLSGFAPNATTEGEIDSMAMYAGTGSALIKEVLPAAQVVTGILEEARAIIEHRLSGLLTSRATRLSELGTML
jgi:NAD(P)H-dependent flavin oxidoreductase YrpB (nitropropane dioxygenase family)